MVADFLQLPSEVLVQILKHVSVGHRLTKCSLVHSTWAAAAVAATEQIYLGAGADLCIKDFTEWLGVHVGHLSSLRFSADWQSVPCIPCSKLCNLEVTCAVLQLQHPSRLSGSMLDAATSLTRLSLQWCNMATVQDSLSTLSALTDLRHLQLYMVGLPGADLMQAAPFDAGLWAPIPGSIFSQMLQLTYLDIKAGTGGTTQETFQHLACLTGLQHLALASLCSGSADDPDRTTEGITGLSTLTQLTCLKFVECWATFRPHSAPLLTPLTNLRQLHLVQVDLIDPIVLGGMTQLQELVLSCIELEGEASGVAALLAVLQGMQQLTHLWLDNTLDDCLEVPAVPGAEAQAVPEAEAQAVPEAALAPAAGLWEAIAAFQLAVQRNTAAKAAALKPYAALTASSQLRKLSLTACKLPPGAWQHVFAPSKHLPHLTSLEFIVRANSDSAFMSSFDVGRLARRCPRLVSLKIGEAALQEGVSLAPLQRLTELTELQVHGVHLPEDVDVLANMMWLKTLRVEAVGDAVSEVHLQDFSGMGLRSCCVMQDDRLLLQFGSARF